MFIKQPGSKANVIAALEKVRPNLPARPAPPNKRQQSDKEEKTVKSGKALGGGGKTAPKAKVSDV